MCESEEKGSACVFWKDIFWWLYPETFMGTTTYLRLQNVHLAAQAE